MGQEVILGTEGRSYQVSRFADDTIKINDPKLKHLIESNNCNFSSYINPFNTPSISFTISPNVTFFKCNTSSPKLAKQTDKYFFGNYTDRGRACHGYTLYSSHPTQQVPVPTPGSYPKNCDFSQLPVVSSIEDWDPWNPFSFLTSDFSVEYHASDQCHACLKDGSQCPHYPGEFKCLHERGRRLHLAWILGPGTLLIPSQKKTLKKAVPTFLGSLSSPTLKSELKEATHNFDPSKELGDGGFGTVYYGKPYFRFSSFFVFLNTGKLRDGREVAVKRLYERNYKQVAQFLNEIEILTNVRHPSLVTFMDHPLPWPVRMNIAIETATALAYLHASEIVHRDVKTNNILLDNNFRVKVADFGLSSLFPNDVSHVSTAPQGTPGYVDPEYHRCHQLTDKSDFYSFGVVLIELISSLPAVDFSRHRHEVNLAKLAIDRIQNGAFNELIDSCLGFESDSSVERMTTSVAEVAFQCLQLEREMRPSMNEVLEALKGIQEYKDEEIGKIPPPSPDEDNAELLKSSKVPPSPKSVTGRWVSSSNTTISGE
ncbi:hypothetical protein RHMOL_Rhmol09G0152300 [Rhododendron molle]|uniref:Uncharacterized protein n=1 Tax=Rhododendron molle TaxID=49168 RepID=A0ACC0MFD1_RHOML|nr:hypothetical protein RHMOL_Rhmol09G0152300 [Rhododendron molle]